MLHRNINCMLKNSHINIYISLLTMGQLWVYYYVHVVGISLLVR